MSGLGHVDLYCQSIQDARTQGDILQTIRGEMRRLGFQYFNYTLFSTPDREASDQRYFLTDYPEAWIRHYIANNYTGDDLVFHRSSIALRPFSWSDLGAIKTFTPRQRRIFEEGAEAGIRFGAGVPIRGPGRARAAFSVANDMTEAEFGRLFVANRHELHLIATYAHERIMELKLFDQGWSPPALSPREREVLTWISRGKTKGEIADILVISEDTIKAHVKSSCRKLDVHSATHASVKATIHGLIVP